MSSFSAINIQESEEQDFLDDQKNEVENILHTIESRTKQEDEEEGSERKDKGEQKSGLQSIPDSITDQVEDRVYKKTVSMKRKDSYSNTYKRHEALNTEYDTFVKKITQSSEQE